MGVLYFKYIIISTLSENPSQMALSEVVEDMERENEQVKRLHITEMKNLAYKVFGIVTNLREEDGGKIVVFHYERCGKSKEIHRILRVVINI